MRSMDAIFTYTSAAAVLPEARRRIAVVSGLSGRLQRLAHEVGSAGAGAPALAEATELRSIIDDELGWFRDQGIQVKGVAPALLDFPARAVLDGRERVVLLCWQEGEEELAWYHPVEAGYRGRAPIALLDEV